MNLRVFSDGREFVFAEISSRSLPYANRLFVPLIRDDPAAIVDQDLDKNLSVPVLFEGNRYLAFFLLVSNLDVIQHNLQPVGSLEQGDSINILNHILDSLAYPD